MGSHEWTIQTQRQYWAQGTQNKQTKNTEIAIRLIKLGVNPVAHEG